MAKNTYSVGQRANIPPSAPGKGKNPVSMYIDMLTKVDKDEKPIFKNGYFVFSDDNVEIVPILDETKFKLDVMSGKTYIPVLEYFDVDNMVVIANGLAPFSAIFLLVNGKIEQVKCGEGMVLNPWNSNALLLRIASFLITSLASIAKQYLSNNLLPDTVRGALMILKFWQKIMELKGSNYVLKKLFCDHLEELIKVSQDKNNIIHLVLGLLNKKQGAGVGAGAGAAAVASAEPDDNDALRLMLFIMSGAPKDISAEKLYSLILFMYFFVNMINEKVILTKCENVVNGINQKVSTLLNGIIFTEVPTDDFPNVILRIIPTIDLELLHERLCKTLNIEKQNVIYYVGPNSKGDEVVKQTTQGKSLPYGLSTHNIGSLAHPMYFDLPPGNYKVDAPHKNLTVGKIIPVKDLPRCPEFFEGFMNSSKIYQDGVLQNVQCPSDEFIIEVSESKLKIIVGGCGEGEQNVIIFERNGGRFVIFIAFKGNVNIKFTPLEFSFEVEVEEEEEEVASASAAASAAVPVAAPVAKPHAIPLLPTAQKKYLAQMERDRLQTLLVAERKRAEKEAEEQAKEKALAEEPGSKKVWVCDWGSKRSGGGTPASVKVYLEEKEIAEKNGDSLWKFPYKPALSGKPTS
jgi:hypothetical protein